MKRRSISPGNTEEGPGGYFAEFIFRFEGTEYEEAGLCSHFIKIDLDITVALKCGAAWRDFEYAIDVILF